MQFRFFLIVLMFTFLPLIAHAQRGQVCNPGQFADTSGDREVCRQCPENSVADGTTRSCTTCPVGTAPNAKHSKCVGTRAGNVPVKEPVLPVDAPTTGLSGHSNYFINSNCKPITGLSVTIDVTEDMIYGSTTVGGQSAKGFAFQLNAYSQEGPRTSPPLKGETITTGWQQFIFHVNLNNDQTVFFGQVNQWPDAKLHSLIDNLYVPDKDSKPPYIASLQINGVPAHYKITISLGTDSGSNVNSVTFTVADPNGKPYSMTKNLLNQPWAASYKKLEGDGKMTVANLAPILGFQLDITGPDITHVHLKQGAGTITYKASSPLSAASSALQCFRYVNTFEDANVAYGTLYNISAPKITQTFSVSK